MIYSPVSPDARIVCGQGSDGNRGDQHRAISIARQLHAVGKWPGQQDIIVHEPHDLHRQVQHSGRQFCINGVSVYPGIYDLIEGQHYEVAGRTAAPETSVGKAYTYSGIIWCVYGPAEPDDDDQPRWWVGTGTDDLEIWDDITVHNLFFSDTPGEDFMEGWLACRAATKNVAAVAAIDSLNMAPFADRPNTFDEGWDACTNAMKTIAPVPVVSLA
jgi:hypothetical protein